MPWRTSQLHGRWALLLAAAVALQQLRGAAAAGFYSCAQQPRASNASGPPAELADGRAGVFADAWVREHVAVTYDALSVKDGLGSQVHRLFGVYAVAACAGLRYVHTAGLRHATHFNRSEVRHVMERVNAMLQLPPRGTPPRALAPGTRVVHLGRDCDVGWATLLGHASSARATRQPLLLNISFVYGFVLQHPTMLECVPAFRPQPPSCGLPLLRPVRIGVHIRAGDAANDPRRLLPHAYFFRVVAAIAQELRRLGRDFSIEVYTQAAFGVRHGPDGRLTRTPRHEYVRELHAGLGPHAVLLADMDVPWTFGQMASADVFVHSKSTLSIAAGIVNTQGVNVAPPAGSLPWPWLQASHWHRPANESGTFAPDAWAALAADLAARFAEPCRGNLTASFAPGAAGGTQVRHNNAMRRR